MTRYQKDEEYVYLFSKVMVFDIDILFVRYRKNYKRFLKECRDHLSMTKDLKEMNQC